jgi:hypothetical protein
MDSAWGGQFGHTSVIDLAGAIYVIGGRVRNDIYSKNVTVMRMVKMRTGTRRVTGGVLDGVLAVYWRGSGGY